MNPPLFETLDADTRLIDSRLHRPGMAACYLLRDGDELALIDTGTRHSLPQILQAIDSLGARPEQVRWIIPTHVHLDHAGGAGALMAECPNATLATHPRGLPHMIDPARLQAGASAVYGEAAFARDYGRLDPVPENRALAAEDGQALPLGGRALRYLHTPGHANHHGCVFDADRGRLFTGDAFGLGYRELARPTPFILATTTPVAFDPDAWFDSLDRMLALAPEAVCLTHFGCHDRPERLAPMLRESIQAHMEIALAEEPRGESGREARLEQALRELLIPAAARHCGVARATAEAVLGDDIRLNAQGLAVWLARRARQRARGD